MTHICSIESTAGLQMMFLPVFPQGEEKEGCPAPDHGADHLHCLLHTLPHQTGVTHCFKISSLCFVAFKPSSGPKGSQE